MSEMNKLDGMKKCAALLVFLLGLCFTMNGLAASGYVSGDYMGLDDSTAVVISRTVSIREKPDVRSTRLASASNGTVLDVIGEDGNWFMVEYTDDKGNVYSGYALKNYIVRGAMTLTVLSDNLSAYCAPSRNAKLVGSLSKNTELTVIGTWGDYYIVNLRQASAFIPMSADVETSVSVVDEMVGVDQTGTAYTITDTLLRSGAGRSFRAVVQLPADTPVTVLAITDDNWALIKYGSYTGYVDAADLDL